FPPQPEQLALTRAHDAGQPEQRAPRVGRRSEHLRQLIGSVDAPRGSRADLRSLAGLKVCEWIITAPGAVAASELEDATTDVADPTACPPRIDGQADPSAQSRTDTATSRAPKATAT